MNSPNEGRTDPKFVRRQTIDGFVERANVTHNAMGAPITRRIMTNTRLRMETPTIIQIVTARATTDKLFTQCTVVMFILIFTIPLRAGAQDRNRTAINMAVRPNRVPSGTITIVRNVTDRNNARMAMLNGIDVERADRRNTLAIVRIARLIVTAIFHFRMGQQPMDNG